VTSKDRVNLQNLWQKVCVAKSWNHYVLVKDTSSGTGTILLDDIEIESGNLKEMKQKIKSLI